MTHVGEGRRHGLAGGTRGFSLRDLPDWLRAKRHRIFAGGALGALLAAVVGLMLLPRSLAAVGVAFLVAVLAGVLGLLSLATWWADRRGLTDSGNLWDADTAAGDEPEQVFDGFSVFGDTPP